MILITNGQIVTENGILVDHDIYIERDLIKAIVKKGEGNLNGVTEVIDAHNGIVSPGFIDIHADYIEHMAAPRPTSLIDFNISIRETEKILINNGITTMFHSLSLCKDEDQFLNKPIRYSENVKKFVDIIDNTHKNKHLIRHRFHARLEIDNFEVIGSLKDYIKENKVHLISFMDHSPGQGQYRDLEIYKKTLKGYKDVTDNYLDEIIEQSKAKDKMTIDMIKEIAELGLEKNIAIASHDDDTIEKLALVKEFGTNISEFPITIEVAKNAYELGMYVLAGAPNVLMGGSHSGNLSAAEAIINNTVNILCSDYYPASLLHAIFILNKEYDQDLGQMFNLVTINPAKAVKMDNLIGSIKENKKADIIIIEKIEEDFPVITTTLVDGKVISKINYRS